MADKLNDNKLNEMGETSFGNPIDSATNPWFNPIGAFGRWFTRFFATKAQPYVAQQANPGPTPQHPIGGDAVVSDQVIRGDGMAGDVIRNPVIPQLEFNRKSRYGQFESMDEYPEIGAAFDIYADDCTQLDIRGRKWVIDSESKMAIEEVERCFEQIKLDRYYWDISRNMVKYGDCFTELVIDLNNPKQGIQRLKILNPNFIYRVENEYGYLTDFLQELPQRGSSDWSAFGTAAGTMGRSKFIALDKNQITHFRLHTSDPRFYPYGRGIGSLAIRIFRSLKLMEDAMIVYRLSRAPERRVFYINTGTMPSSKAEAFVQKTIRRFKKEKSYNHSTGNLDEKVNPLSFDEDFFIPHRGDKETKIEVLPGAQNLGEVDDVKYFRDKLLACLKIPKDYIVEFDKSPERKANLSQLDVKFAKVISRVQRDFSVGLETIARRHLAIKGFPQSIINALRISLPDPSDMYTKRRLDVDGQKAQVVQSVTMLQVGGKPLFSRKYVYKEYYDMSDNEIDDMNNEIDSDMEEMAQNPMAAGMGGMPGAPPMPGMPPAPGGPPVSGPPENGEENTPPQQDNGPESRENIPPTAKKEEVLKTLGKLRRVALLEGNRNKIKAINRIIAKSKKSDSFE